MTDELNTLEDCKNAITDRELALIQLRRFAWEFLDSDHTSNDTKEFQIRVRKSDTALGQIHEALLDKSRPEEFRLASKELYQQCRELAQYTHDIIDALANDFAYRHAAEEKAKADHVKNMTFFFGIPAGFIGAVKAGLFGGHVTLVQAAATGFGVSTSVLSIKPIKKAFKAAGKGLCDASQIARYSFAAFYLRETANEKARMAIRAVRAMQARFKIAA